MKRLSILGSTGSIGQSTLDVVLKQKEAFSVIGLAAGKNIDLLEHQIKACRPEIVAVADEQTSLQLRKRVNGLEILFGTDGMKAVACHEKTDFVISAIVGSAGLVPTASAVESGKNIGLANKEALVMAGELIMESARKHAVKIIPVDSEHSAVFQCVEGRSLSEVQRVVLTASGGPFLDRKREELDSIKAEDALKHPNWSMGRKITIDSATLMNKGLEVIEARWLFSLRPEQIDVLIHPQSIVHSLVEFRDRSFLAQLSVPDMRGPISYALSYPDRPAGPVIPALELDKIGTLTFRKPDHKTFPCLSYAYEALQAGGTMPAVLNAANEATVNAFLDGMIGFNDIPAVIRRTIDSHVIQAVETLEAVIEADRWAREKANHILKEFSI